MALSAHAEIDVTTKIPDLSTIAFENIGDLAGREAASIDRLLNPEWIQAAKFQSAF